METEKEKVAGSEQKGGKGGKANGSEREARGKVTKTRDLSKARGRTDSLGTLSDYIQKRKREGAEEEIAKAEKEILEKFNEARKVSRSPPFKIKREEKKENRMAMEEMFKEILKKLEEQEKERRKDKEEIKEEIKELKEEIRRKDEVWELQKSQLQERIRSVEEKIKKIEISEETRKEERCIVERVKEMERCMEREERKRRRNNIVVKGDIMGNELDRKQRTERMIMETHTVKTAVEKVQEVGYGRNKMTLIKCKSWEAKREVMKDKKKIGKMYGVYLDDDLTKEERQIQKGIRETAKKEKQAGKKVTIGYQKMWVDNKEMRWDEEKGRLEERNSFRSQ